MKIHIENFNSNLNKRGFDINNFMDFMLIDIEIKGLFPQIKSWDYLFEADLMTINNDFDSLPQNLSRYGTVKEIQNEY